MSIFKRAFLYILRKPSRSLVLALILFSMGMLMLAGISVRTSAAAAAEDVRGAMTSGFDLKIKYGTPGEALYDGYTNEKGEFVRVPKIKFLTQEGADKIMEIDGVKGRYSQEGPLILYAGLNVAPGLFADGYQYLLENNPDDYSSPRGYEEELLSFETNSKSHQALGVDESEWQPYFMNGALELTEGRHLKSTDERKTLISTVLAEQNGLAVGDTIKANEFDFVTGEVYGVPYEMEIVGLYKVNFEQEISEYTSEPDIMSNMIFTSKGIDDFLRVQYRNHYGTQAIVREEDSIGAITFYVDDPLRLDGIMEEVRGLDIVDWDYYDLEKKDDDYQTMAGPLTSMANLSTLLFAVVAIGCFGIMAMLLTMWTRNRRTEIGILTSIGLRKSNILLQFILECLVIAMVAFLIAVLVAGPITSAIGNAMADMAGPSGGDQPYSVSVALETWEITVAKAPSESIDLSYIVSPQTTLLVICAMAGVALIAVLISAGSIARMKPREILTRR